MLVGAYLRWQLTRAVGVGAGVNDRYNEVGRMGGGGRKNIDITGRASSTSGTSNSPRPGLDTRFTSMTGTATTASPTSNIPSSLALAVKNRLLLKVGIRNSECRPENSNVGQILSYSDIRLSDFNQEPSSMLRTFC